MVHYYNHSFTYTFTALLPLTLLYLLGKLHPCLNPARLPCPYSLAAECGWRKTAKLMLPGLIFHSLPNLKGAFSAALESYYIFPDPFTLPHSLFLLSSNLHTASTILTLNMTMLTISLRKKNNQGKKCQIPTLHKLPALYLAPVVCLLSCSCGWKTRAFISGQPSIVH